MQMVSETVRNPGRKMIRNSRRDLNHVGRGGVVGPTPMRQVIFFKVDELLADRGEIIWNTTHFFLRAQRGDSWQVGGGSTIKDEGITSLEMDVVGDAFEESRSFVILRKSTAILRQCRVALG